MKIPLRHDTIFAIERPLGKIINLAVKIFQVFRVSRGHFLTKAKYNYFNFYSVSYDLKPKIKFIVSSQF
jgi:hypothetical protein